MSKSTATKVPLTILIPISIALSVSVTIAAAQTGVLDSLINPTSDLPLINSTVTGNDNKTYHVLVEKTKEIVTTPPSPPIINETEPPVVIPPVINNTDNTTTPNPEPTPTPTPTPVPQPTTNQSLKVIMLGDVKDGTSGNAVFNAVKKQNANLVFVLGDLGYASDLKWFKSTYGSLAPAIFCVQGNHDSANEDGSSSVEKETQAYCGNNSYQKKGVNLFLTFNTNGNLDVQLGEAQNLVMNKDFMKGIKNVFVETHKPCKTPSGAHHPAEPDVKTLCDSLKAKIPTDVKIFFNAGHNHYLEYGEASDGTLYTTSGAGGRSHYACGTPNSVFTWCNDSSYGYLEYIIKPDGAVDLTYYDYNGKVLH